MSAKHTGGEIRAGNGQLGYRDELIDSSARIFAVTINAPGMGGGEKEANAARLAECWNALVSVPDPAKFMEAARRVAGGSDGLGDEALRDAVGDMRDAMGDK